MSDEGTPQHDVTRTHSDKPRRVLVVFEKFPPFTLSGSWRPFFFVKHLPEFGYLPHVIGAEPTADDPTDEKLLDELDPRCRTVRKSLWVAPPRAWVEHLFRRKKTQTANSNSGATAASTANEQSVANTRSAAKKTGGSYQDTRRFKLYWAFVWRLYWYLDWGGPAVCSGLWAALRHRFDLIWVSGPHSRNLFAAYWLSILLRKPLIVDLRDPWTYGSLWTPKTRNVANAEKRWALRILKRARRIVFTSPLTRAEMAARFPEVPPERMTTITNGFAKSTVEPLRSIAKDICLFRYVGSLNDRRRPDVLLQAFAHLRANHPEFAASARLEFIGGMAGHAARIADYELLDVVTDVGRVSHADSVRMIAGADVNILLQTITEGQDVISGKAFEYLAARKPILAVVAPDGGDAWLVEKTGAGVVAAFDDVAAVAVAMQRCWQAWRDGDTTYELSDADLEPYSRRSLTAELATLFDEVLNDTGSKVR